MILDKLANLGEDVAFGDTGPSLVLGPEINGNYRRSMGPGEPILIYFTGTGLAAVGDPILVVEEQDSGVPGWSTLMSLTIGPQTANARGVVFGLPTNVANEIRISLTNFTAGTWEAWVVLKATL